jgi:hypothetical protein
MQKEQIMKNSLNIRWWMVTSVTLSLLMIVGYWPSTGKAAERSRWSKVGRYENNRIGFSVEYDAEKLTRENPLEGNDVFERSSSGGLPVLSVSISAFPQGVALKDIANVLKMIFPSVIPGSQVHEVTNQKMIMLPDQTEANYFEMKWNDGNTELSSVFVVVQKENTMISVSGHNKAERDLEDVAAMATTLRFDVKVDEASLRKTGFGEDGLFVRTDSPAFTLQYPKDFQNQPLQAGEIFKAGIPQGSPSISITINPLKPDQDVKKQLSSQADLYANKLKSMGTDIKIISNGLIDNYRSYPASQFEIVWKFQGKVLLTSLVRAIAKENKVILLGGHTVYDTGELLDIFETIDLNP